MPKYPFEVPCIQCNGKALLSHLRNNGDRTYVCRRCGGVQGEVTEYALCMRNPKNGQVIKDPKAMRVLERDNKYNDCSLCPYYRENQTAIRHRGLCPFYYGKLSWEQVWNDYPDYCKQYNLRNIEV